jgi:hypothetical protein
MFRPAVKVLVAAALLASMGFTCDRDESASLADGVEAVNVGNSAPAEAGVATTAAERPKDEASAPVSSCIANKDARSTEDGAAVTLTFANRTGEYRVVERIDEGGTFAGVAHLQPGETFVAAARRSHVWMVMDGPGNCIEILLAPQDGSEVEITLPSPGFGDEGD